MILTYYPNFNTFYNKNLVEMETFLWSVAWKYQHIVEPEDMVQEIVLRLMRSNVLQKWNKNKSALNTFITSRIRGYALHIITKKMQKEPKAMFMVRLDRHHEFDGDDDGETPGYFIEIGTESLEEEELYVEEIKELFKRKVGPVPYKIYDMHYWQGYTFQEMVAILNKKYGDEFPYSTIRTMCTEATHSLLKILSKEGVHCEK